MKTGIFFISVIFFIVTFKASGQSWIDALMGRTDKNFYEIQKEFNEFAAKVNLDTVSGWKQYKRWEWFMEPRVYPTGQLPNPMATYNAMNDYYRLKGYDRRSANRRSSGNWHILGPVTQPGKGIGRINFVTFHPTEPNTLFVGAPSGGLWKSEDGGSTWVSMIDNLEVIGCSDLVINPLNPMTMYLASSDGDASDTYSLGVLKSTNGGKTWNTTGLNWQVTQFRKIRKILMHPNDTSILFAATSVGIYKTTDAGQTWQFKQTGTFTDIEFKPGNPNVIYAARYGYSGAAGFYRSTDGGNTFQNITNGISVSSSIRFEIAVTPADTNIVYVVVAKQSNYSLAGVFRSNDGGSSFTKVKDDSAPNLLGRSSSGSDLSVGQGWYDLDIIASPANKDEVYVGGINIWKSTDGGKNWTLNAHWTGSGAPYVHADIHAMEFFDSTGKIIYIGCDGGLYRSTDGGKSYVALNSGLAISQIYRIGISATDPDLYLIGLQDNGTKRYKNSQWDDVNGGDGFECIVDYSDKSVMYASTQYGRIYRSLNGGASFKRISSGIPESGGWLTPYVMDPVDHKTLYAGYTNIYKTTNQGNTWTSLTSFSGSNKFDAIAVAPSNNQVIYAAVNNTLYKTTDGGQNWSDITKGLPNLYITYIAVHPDYPERLWVTLSGYNDGHKVYLSPDGGLTWINYSGSLPNLPANCIVYQKGSDNGLYVGMDVGVYYRDSTLTDWIPFNNGLPNVIVNELEIYYASDPAQSRIRAATYGRGSWESELYFPPNTPPVAQFSARDTLICLGYSNRFTNLSTNADSFYWYFEGGYPTISYDRNPIVRYDSAGTFDVLFIAFNDYGKDSIYRTDYIHVDPVQDCEYIMSASNPGEIFTSCQGLLLDPGGENNYPDNVTTYITIAPPDAESIILIFEDFDLENKADSIMIFEGYGIKGKHLGTYTGNIPPQHGVIISHSSAITVYFLSDAAVNRPGFKIRWKCLRQGSPPVAHFYTENRYSCDGKIYFHLTDLMNIDRLTWYFGDGNTSSDKNPVHEYNENGQYSVKLVVENQYGSDSFVVDNIVIDKPEDPQILPGSVCQSGKAQFIGLNGGNFKWYDSPGSTTPLAEGDTFVTPHLTQSTTYYVERFENGPSQFTGILSGAGDGAYSSSPNGLVFDVYKDLTLVSVKVYTLGAGPREFHLINKNGDTLQSVKKNLINGEQTVKLNFEIAPGTDYQLATGNVSTMWRTRSGIHFPYEIPGLISIKRSITGDDYSFFYKWEVQEKNVCKSNRIAVTAGVFNQAPAADFSYIDSGLYVWFFDNSQNPFLYFWDFGDNQTSSETNPVHMYMQDGTYTVKLVVENGCGKDSTIKSVKVVNAIFEKENLPYFLVYPNPASRELSVNTNAVINEISVLNAQGKAVKNVYPKQTPFKIKMDVPSGLYLIRFVTSRGTFYKKVIIRK